MKPSENTRSIGRMGEDAAARWLTAAGYTILARNLYAGGCEVDILASGGGYLAFVEVKSRRMLPDAPDKFGRPADAVTDRKRQHMYAAARAYLHNHPEIQEIPRLDVLEVYLRANGETLEIRHYPGAGMPRKRTF